MIKTLSLISVLASSSLLQPSATPLNWSVNYDVGDLEDTTFNFSYGNFGYNGVWGNPSAINQSATNQLSNGKNTIVTTITFSSDNPIFNQDYTYLPVYAGYQVNGVEYLDFYLVQDSVNVFVIDTSEYYSDDYDCLFVYKFPTSLDINHESIYTSDGVLNYSNTCFSGDLFGVDAYINAYNDGYNYGYNIGFSDGTNEGYAEGYATGEQVGYNEGVATDVTTNGMKTLFNSILSYPVNLLRSVLNFNFMGINVADFVLFLVSVLIVVFVIKFFI